MTELDVNISFSMTTWVTLNRSYITRDLDVVAGRLYYSSEATFKIACHFETFETETEARLADKQK